MSFLICCSEAGLPDAGLPDGILSSQKFQIWVSFGGLPMECAGIFYVHLVYFSAIGYILWVFGIFSGNLENYFPFWYVIPRKIWQT
jgi:hypothetical protein